MKRYQIRKNIIRIVVLIGVLINGFYGIELLKIFFETHSNAFREVLISAIALEFSWAALLIWVLFKPFVRRPLLLFTAMAMMLGNVLHSINQGLNSTAAPGTIVLNLLIGLAFAGLFILAYYLGSPNKTTGKDS